MKEKIIAAIAATAIAATLCGGDGASQKWVNYRLAQEGTNTDAKVMAATNGVVAAVQGRIDAHLSTNGVSGAWVEYKIAEQETNTQATVDAKIADVRVSITNVASSIIVKRTDTPSNTVFKCGKLTAVIAK